MKRLLILATLLFAFPAQADMFEQGNVVYANFFCKNIEAVEHLASIAKNKHTTLLEMNLEMGVSVQTGECVFLANHKIPLTTTQLLTSFIDFANKVQEVYELTAPGGYTVYSFTPVGYALKI